MKPSRTLETGQVLQAPQERDQEGTKAAAFSECLNCSFDKSSCWLLIDQIMRGGSARKEVTG